MLIIRSLDWVNSFIKYVLIVLPFFFSLIFPMGFWIVFIQGDLGRIPFGYFPVFSLSLLGQYGVTAKRTEAVFLLFTFILLFVSPTLFYMAVKYHFNIIVGGKGPGRMFLKWINSDLFISNKRVTSVSNVHRCLSSFLTSLPHLSPLLTL